jgi:tetratricopeptide (TPR) repeat protein
MYLSRYRLLSFFLFYSITGVSFADTPPWVLLEQGRAAYEVRNLTDAMDHLLKAVEIQKDYPEVEYWLGRVYEAQGQPILAEEQYRRALELSIYLRVPDDRLLYTYSLAELLMNRGPEGRRNAETLLTGIANEERYSTPENLVLEHKYMKLTTEAGLDDLVYLYRDELNSSLKARRILGEMAWDEGRYRSSLLHSTRVVLSLLTSASSRYREKIPDWRFDIDPINDPLFPDRDVRFTGTTDGVADLLNLIYSDYPRLGDWLENEGLWPQLYLLSVSLFAGGYTDKAASIWNLMTEIDPVDGRLLPKRAAGRWGRLAVRQLSEPFISVGSLAP